MRKIIIVPALSGLETHLLGTGLILTTPASTWTGEWLGRARVRRKSYREDGLAYLTGSNARQLAREVEAAPDPLILVLYQGSTNGGSYRSLAAAVQARRSAGAECRLVVAAEIEEVRLTVEAPGSGSSGWEVTWAPTKKLLEP